MRSIILLFSCCLLLPGQTVPAPDSPDPIVTPPIKPEDKCTIEGSVLNAATGEAVKKVTVTLRQLSRNNSIFGAATDASGHYKFDNLDPGRYIMSADRPGFVQQRYGAKGPSPTSNLFTLTAGQNMKDAVFKLTPQGVVTGKVVDEDGDPMAHVMLQCQRYVYNNGKKQLAQAGVANTNDLGEYRIFGLAPGRYYVTAFHQSPPQQGAVVDPKKNYEEGYAPVYYPNAASAEAAAPLEVTPGAQLRGIDLRLTKTRTVVLRGVVTVAGTNKPVRSNVSLMGRESSGMAIPRAFGRGVDEKGNFEIHAVVPGSYFLVAQTYEEGKQSVARVPIEVGTSNIDGLQVTVNPPVDITGRVVVENNAEHTGMIFSVALQSKAPGPFGAGASAQADKDGAFKIRNVTPDAYTINVTGLLNNFYVKSVRFGDTDVSEATIDFTQGVPAGEITVVVSPDGGQVNGTVQNDTSQPAGSVTVALIPNAEKRNVARLYKVTSTDPKGNFYVMGVAPGEYKLFAWEQIENGAYLDPEFLKRYESKGQAVSIKEKSKETPQLLAIPAQEMK